MTETVPPEVTDRDVYITRVFAAPVATVWRFWTDPDLLAQWFGPHGVSTPRESVTVDAREEGDWRLSMQDDAGVYPLVATIVTITEHEYLEVVMSADTGLGQVADVLLRVRFHDHGDSTRITLHQGPFTPDQRDATRDGWMQSFDKIDTILVGGNA